MAKKYKHTTEDAQMAKEPEAAYAYTNKPTYLHIASTEDRHNIDAAITAQELRNRLHESLKYRFKC